jgi:multidrug efflux pump
VNLSAPFVRRPVATTLLTAAVALAGAIAWRILPAAPLPQVDFPTIQVSAALPGASPETMASSVAAPLERQFGQIAGVTEMTSTSYLGSTAVVMQFDLGRDIDGAARDVQAAINAARSFLPPALPTNPSYRKVNPAEAPILILALTSDTLGRGALYDAASSVVQQKLSQVPGVGQVVVGGGALPAVRVKANPLSLAHYGIPLETVRTVLGATNTNRPKGDIDDGRRTRTLVTNDQLLHADGYRDLVVAYRGGQAVQLSDVAEIEDSMEDVRTAGLSDGKPAVVVVVFRQPNANIIETVDRVRALVPALAASIPQAIGLEVVLDRSTTIRASLRDVQLTLLLATVLVTAVVFVFLRSVRATLIPAVAVPVSLLGTFGVMYLCGFSVNNLSLMALTIATGFVIDDAIVVLENVVRHREAGMAPLEAALLGAREIGFTVLSMSLSLVAVFIPILLMGGIVGRLFREFAVTLSVAVLLSLLVSLTTTPMMCAAVLGPRPQGRLFHATERGFTRLLALYERSLAVVLRHPALMLATMPVTIALSGFLLTRTPKGFFPEQDTGRLSGVIQAAQDVSFQALQKKLTEVVRLVGEDPAVAHVIGFTGGGGGTATNVARLFVTLHPRARRGLDADAVIARLRRRLAHLPATPVIFQAVQDVRVGGRAGNAQYQYTLSGNEVRTVQAWAPRVLEAMRALPDLADLSSDQQDRGRQSLLQIDRDRAARLGLSVQAVDDTLYDALGQRQVSTIYTRMNQYHVVMEVAPPFTQGADALGALYVGAPAGALVPLGAFSRHQPTSTPLAVNHDGQFPAVTLSFNLVEGAALGQAVTEIQGATRRLGLPTTISARFRGTAQAFQQSLAAEPMLILVALLAVYLVLGVLYESYAHPLTILSTLPSAGLGALLALVVFRTQLTVVSLIGIILLIGIVKKNGIMMVDVALEVERREKSSPRDAIFQACLLRFRPIMMTTSAALFGALPLALGRGEGSELRRPLGVAIVGGLIVSQLFTLYTTPVVYLEIDRLRQWLRRWRGGLALALLALAAPLASACKVGPDYVRPPAATPAAYKEAAWRPAQPRDAVPREAWWEVFGDPTLAGLEMRVSVSNQSLAAAESAYRQASAAVREARAALFPTVGVSASYSYLRTSTTYRGAPGAAPGATPSAVALTSAARPAYSLPASASWQPDFWGGVRRNVEASAADAQASAADVETARLSLQSELAQNYLQLRVVDEERRLYQRTTAAYEKALALTRSRFTQGVASRADVVQAESQLATARAQGVDLDLQRAQLEHAIAILVGVPPAQFALAQADTLPAPPEIPAGVPSQLLERRPDIAAAERRVASANARIGVQVAAYFPTVTLSGSAGFQSSILASWFTWPSFFFAVGPTIAQTLFDGGLRGARTEQARAAHDAAVASYRQTVLGAFQGVEDNLAALRLLGDESRFQDEAVTAAEESLALTLNQYRAGTVGYLNVITAQTIALGAQTSALQIRGRRLAASVLLVQALGGGWDVGKLRGP